MSYKPLELMGLIGNEIDRLNLCDRVHVKAENYNVVFSTCGSRYVLDAWYLLDLLKGQPSGYDAQDILHGLLMTLGDD